jgi:hypothetical protein
LTEPSSHLRLRLEIHVTFGPSSCVANTAGVTRRDGRARRLERLWRDDHDVARGAFAVGKGEELRPVEVTA